MKKYLLISIASLLCIAATPVPDPKVSGNMTFAPGSTVDFANADVSNISVVGASLPAMAGHTDQFLQTNGSTASWQALPAFALDSAAVHKSGNEAIGGTKTFSAAPVVPDNSFAESKVTNLVTDLAAKVATSRQVNGHALSTDVTLNATDVGALASLPAGKTIWVDAETGIGNDATGLRGRQDKPFKSLGAAKSASLTGDLIWVRKGDYTGTDLFKDGVNWHFESGAAVTNSSSTTGIFDDYTGHNNQFVTCKITGSGDFVAGAFTTSNSGSVLNLKTTLHFDTSGSSVVFEANSVTTQKAAMVLHGKTIDVKVNRVIQTGDTAVIACQYIRGNGSIDIGELRTYASQAAFSIGGNSLSSDEMSRRYQQVSARFGSITNLFPSATARAIFIRPIGDEVFQGAITAGQIEADTLAVETSSANVAGNSVTITAGTTVGTIKHNGGEMLIRPGLMEPKTSGDAVTVTGGTLTLEGGTMGTSPPTAIATGSNAAELPQSNIYIYNVNNFSSTGGTVIVPSTAGPQTITYTGVSTTGGDHLTGCSGGTGTMNTTGAKVIVSRTGYDLNQTGGTLIASGFSYNPLKVNGTVTSSQNINEGTVLGRMSAGVGPVEQLNTTGTGNVVLSNGGNIFDTTFSSTILAGVTANFANGSLYDPTRGDSVFIWVNGHTTSKYPLEFSNNEEGPVIKSPNGTAYQIKVANDGTLSASAYP